MLKVVEAKCLQSPAGQKLTLLRNDILLLQIKAERTNASRSQEPLSDRILPSAMCLDRQRGRKSARPDLAKTKSVNDRLRVYYHTFFFSAGVLDKTALEDCQLVFA